MAVNNWDIIAQFFSPEEIKGLKDLFARLMVKYHENTDSILQDKEFVYQVRDVACRLYIINEWRFDKEVEQRILHYQSEGLETILPNKMQVAGMYMELAKRSIGTRDKILALEAYSKIMGFDRDDNQRQTGATQNVILVTDNGTDMSWEEKLASNQLTLQKKADSVLGLDNDEDFKH